MNRGEEMLQRQWQPTPPFEALPAGFLTTLRQFPATASFAMPVSDFR